MPRNLLFSRSDAADFVSFPLVLVSSRERTCKNDADSSLSCPAMHQALDAFYFISVAATLGCSRYYPILQKRKLRLGKTN